MGNIRDVFRDEFRDEFRDGFRDQRAEEGPGPCLGTENDSIFGH